MSERIEWIKKNIHDLRSWLDSVERDLDAPDKIVNGVAVQSIGEKCTTLIYNIGRHNGVLVDAKERQ